MRYFALIWVNLRRKKMRTLLTISSFGVALFLYGLLVTINAAFNQGVEVAGVDRVVVRNHISLIMPLPISYKERLLQIDGVTHVTYASWFGGVYQDERNFFPQFAIDVETYREMFSEFIIDDEQWKTFVADREGCFVGRSIAKKFGFKVGDRIPFRGTIFQGNWEFNVCGIFDVDDPSVDTNQFWFQYKYLEERSEWSGGLVGWYYVKIGDPDRAAEVTQAIDTRFANSPYETTSETEKAFAAGFVKQFGNIKLVMLSVGAVVFFTLLLITGSNMSMSIRERTSEIAVLKTIGFSNAAILFMVLGESLIYALTGGIAGIGLCKLFTLGGDPTGGMLPLFYLSPNAMITGVLVAAVVGLGSGSIPAILAMRLKIVNAMRRV